MHSFEVHSNESACKKRGRLGLEQVTRCLIQISNHKAKTAQQTYYVALMSTKAQTAFTSKY